MNEELRKWNVYEETENDDRARKKMLSDPKCICNKCNDNGKCFSQYGNFDMPIYKCAGLKKKE